MKLTIDKEAKILTIEDKGKRDEIDLYSKEAFELLSHEWLRLGWNQKYSYTFSWLGRPVIQIPDDMIRIQEVIYKLQPDVIIELGVAHGGFSIFLASLCKLLDKGKVISVDIDIRPHNRKALDEHPLRSLLTLIQGSSVSCETVKQVKSYIKNEDKVLVFLDSNHTKNHVSQELELYSPLVSSGSYLIVADGFMESLTDVPRGKKEWREDNPIKAVQEFLEKRDDFFLEVPKWGFNESNLAVNITYWSSGWLKRR